MHAHTNPKSTDDPPADGLAVVGGEVGEGEGGGVVVDGGAGVVDGDDFGSSPS
jgi:hypothetical protein